jgi:hypothetical protein
MEAPTPPSQLRRWSPLWTSLAAVGLFLVALVGITSVALDDQVFNFARDLSAAIPALLLVAAAVGCGRDHAAAWAGWPVPSSWSAWRCSGWAMRWRLLASGVGAGMAPGGTS